MDTKKELIIRILDSLNKGGKLLSKEDLCLDLQQYGEILDNMKNSQLITGVLVLRKNQSSPPFNVDGKNSKITINGIKYLEENRKLNLLEELNNNIKILTKSIEELNTK